VGRDGVTVIVPALDEECDLESAVRTALDVAPRHASTVEVLVFDDGSRDGTGAIADRLAAADPRVRAIHHDRPMGPGAVFLRGVAAARTSHVIVVQGKDDTPAEALDAILGRRGRADAIVPYTLNSGDRPLVRRALSAAFVAALNAATGLRLRYYNHSVLHRTDLVRTVPVRTSSYAYQAEVLIDLLRRGCSYEEVGVTDRFDPGRRTRAFRPANVIGVAGFVAGVAWRSINAPGRPA